MKIYAVRIEEQLDDDHATEYRNVSYHKTREGAEKVREQLNDYLGAQYEENTEEWQTPFTPDSYWKKRGIIFFPDEYVPDSAEVIEIDVQED